MSSFIHKVLASVLVFFLTLSLWLPFEGQAAAAPYLTAPVAYAIDAKSGEILYEKNIDSPRSVASLTKVMTALLVFEGVERGDFSWTTKVPISRSMKAYAHKDYSGHNFNFPDEETLLELTKLLLVGSSNCAASILAEYMAGSEAAFVDRMNQRARELGMNAAFNDASGLKANAVSARAMVDLSHHMIQRYPEFTSLTQQSGGNYRGKFYRSANRLYSDHYYEGADGIKTGWTPTAGYSFVASAERGGERVIGIVSGSSSYNNEFVDASKLLDYGFAVIAGRANPLIIGQAVAEDVRGQAFASLYDKVNLRSGPGTNFDRLGQVQKGTAFSGIQEKNGWYELSYQDRKIWVRKDLVIPIEAVPESPAPETLDPKTEAPEQEPTAMGSSQQQASQESLITDGEEFPTAGWALEDMQEASRLGYDFTELSGRSAFNGSQELNRAEFAALLVKAYHPNEKAIAEHPFLDVSPDAWYQDFIAIAYEKDLIAGMTLDQFAPKATISREQAATMIARAEQLTTPVSYGYRDESSISAYALESVLGLAHAGIMVGDADGHFRPQDPISRQEGTALVLRLHHLAA